MKKSIDSVFDNVIGVVAFGGSILLFFVPGLVTSTSALIVSIALLTSAIMNVYGIGAAEKFYRELGVGGYGSMKEAYSVINTIFWISGTIVLIVPVMAFTAVKTFLFPSIMVLLSGFIFIVVFTVVHYRVFKSVKPNSKQH